MGIEIERKFLVNGDFSRETFLIKKEKIIQHYVLSEKNRNIRIRQKGEKAFITFKSGSHHIKRSEFEYEIPRKDFEELKKLYSDSPSVEKTRFTLKHEEDIWEVDVFEGKNKGLIMAEIELESEQQKFKKPDWLGEEVTEFDRYFNSSLAENPYQNWKNSL